MMMMMMIISPKNMGHKPYLNWTINLHWKHCSKLKIILKNDKK